MSTTRRLLFFFASVILAMVLSGATDEFKATASAQTPQSQDAVHVDAKRPRPWVGTDFGPKSGLPPDNPVVDIEVHPSNPDKIYLAGYNGFTFSEDGGMTWITNATGLTGFNGYARSLAIDVTSPHVFLGTSSGEIFISDDGGRSWVEKYSVKRAEVSIIAIHPTTPTIVYAGTASGLYRSTDGGDTWLLMPVEQSSNTVVAQVIVDGDDPARVYVVEDGGYLFVSNDAGETWDSVGIPAEWIAFDPVDPKVIWHVASDRLYRSDNRGMSWREIAILPVYFKQLYVNPADRDVLYLWTPGVNWPYRSIDRGVSWHPLNWVPGGYIGDFSAFTMNLADPARLYAYGFDRERLFWDLYVSGDAAFLPFISVHFGGDAQ